MAPLRSTAVLALLTWLLPACGGEDTDVPIVAPEVWVSSIVPSVGARWEYVANEPSTPMLVMPCDGVVAIGATTTVEFLARPPGGCGETQNCGYVKIVASFAGKELTEGALQTPALFTFENTVAGAGTVSATLVDDQGADYPDLVGKPITDSIDVTFEPATGCE
jgi:hypothetical protein